jgi:hypothetical protein
MGLGNFVQGAIGGATGGSAFGPLGAIGGGILGGIGGMMGSDPAGDQERQRQEYLRSIANRRAPELGPAAQSDYSGFRRNQSNLISNLEAMARGEGPSVSREMFNQATNRNIAAQTAMASGGRGNGNLGAMMAMNNSARLGADASQGAALGRVQEQNNAINNLGMQIYSGRNADEANNQFNAGQTNYNNRDRAQLQNQFYGIQDQANLGAMSQGRPGASTADQIMAGGGTVRAWYDAQNAQRPGNGGPQNSWANR